MRVQQKQIIALQVIIAEKIIIAEKRGAGGGGGAGSNIEMVNPPMFNGEASRVGGFITVCRLYLRMRMRGATVEEQIQWVLLYVQRGLANVWKENLLEDLELRELEFGLAEEFLLELKKEFDRGDEKSVKVVELKRVEQEKRMMEEFVQEFRRAARESGCEERTLVEKLKREMNRMIRRKLMETERPPTSIEQQYKYATNLDRHWRESQREEEKLRERKESGNQEQRQGGMGNNQGGFRL